jgi:hypothetical protein
VKNMNLIPAIIVVVLAQAGTTLGGVLKGLRYG